MRLPGSKRRTLRSYAREVPPRLVARFGHAQSYSPAQVREVLDSLHMTSPWEGYIYALTLDPDAFAASGIAERAKASFWTMRAEMLGVLQLSSNANFEEILAAAEQLGESPEQQAASEARTTGWLELAILAAGALFVLAQL